MRYKSLILSLVLLTVSYANGQSVTQPNERGHNQETYIYGRVFGGGGRVDNASIYLEGTSVHTSSNERGEYRLLVPKAGTYTLVVSRVGQDMYREQVVLKQGEQRQRDIRLQLNRKHNLRELVVTANRRKRKEQELGFAMQVIETQRVATQSLQTSELLERSAGVKVRQDGGLGSHTHFNLNGFSGNAVRIFVDGVPADNLGSSFSIQSIPPALLERVEVFKGVVPGYLASDALGGAINIVLKEQKRNSL